MRIVVCTGRTSVAMMLAWFRPKDGLRRPYHVATMDELWFEAAAEYRLPRTFFKNKLSLMRFVNGHEIICIEARDGAEETASMGASMFAMGAKSIPIASDEEMG